jgi:phytoene dehydrogenase-like protein
MLGLLGLREAVSPLFLAHEFAHEFRMESVDQVFGLPSGLANVAGYLRSRFPGDAAAVDRFFELLRRVRAETVSMDPARLDEPMSLTDLDYVTLKHVVDGLTSDAVLKAVLCGLSTCHGTKPSEISFANHARVCFDLYEATARIDGGGDALIRAFRERFRALPVEVRCGQWIAECLDLRADRAGRFRLNTGEEVAAADAVLTIHPRDILTLLPPRSVTPAFRDRVAAFESSAGFFTLFGVVAPEAPEPAFASRIVSLFPLLDIDAMIDPAYDGLPPLLVTLSVERTRSGPVRTLTALEPSFPRHVEPWLDTHTGERPAAYAEYKARGVARVLEHVGRHYPECVAQTRVVDAASILTFRDYLHSPDGAAYGIKQKMGQFNLLGRLPVRNLYAAGQSSLLPGLAGAMMSAFIVCRALLGREAYGEFARRRLCRQEES